MYVSYYGLKAKPFALSPDARFFFNSRGHKRALAYLRYGVKQGEGFIIITGDVGTGKTTLVGALTRALERENVVVGQVVTTQLQAEELLRMVAAGFGLAYQRVGKATLLKSLEIFFRACADEGKRALLIVDEAQGLPPRAIEELRMLSNFQQNGRMLLQSFLLGQREFRTTMRSEGFEQLRQRVIAAYHLKPLGVDECRSYIEHRLRTVGWNNNPILEDPIFELIHEFTGGVPRRINTLCDRLLLFGSLEELKVLGADALQTVAGDIMEEQGLGPEPDPVPMSVPGVLAPLPIEPNAATAANGQGDQRLAAVESSVSNLADAVREELALLRQTLADRDKPH
ncbi:MAG: general secretion pathway protein A [Gammaproteobacteria bacterium]|jgi:general secretion pathway protein A